MIGFKFTLDSPYFVSFRRANSSSLLSSYKIPPFTTIRGLISNALGLKRDDLYLQDLIKIGIKSYNINYSSEMTKVLKLKQDKVKYNRNFPSSPIFKEFLIFPKYDIYIAGNDDIIHEINEKLKDPVRNLYLGSSDDMIDLNIFDCIQINLKIGKPISVVEGIYDNSTIEKIPFKFNKKGKNFNLEEKIVSIPNNIIDEEMEVYDFNGEYVYLF